MNSEEMAKIMTTLSAAYPRQPITPATMQVYSQMLSDLDYKQVQAAVIKHIATNSFFPSIAEIRQAVLDVGVDRLPSPSEAWLEVQKQIRDVGSYRTPNFSNSLIEKTVSAMGGWVDLCRSEEPVGVERAHFLRIYEALMNREIEQLKSGSLIEKIACPSRPLLRVVE